MYDVSEAELYTISIFPAFFVELFFQGILFNPVLLLLLGGPALFIYASIVVVPKKVSGDKEYTLQAKIFTIVLLFMGIIVGAVVADNLNAYYGFG